MSALHFATRLVWTLGIYIPYTLRERIKTRLIMNDDPEEGETQTAEVILVSIST